MNKIVNIQTQAEYIALKTPFITALRKVENIEFIRVKILYSSGNYSLGEAPATKVITGEDLEIIMNSISLIKHKLIGLNAADALVYLHSSHIGSSAKASLDMALISLIVQEKKMSLSEYFKISDFTPLETDITISLNPKRKMLSDAREAFESGMSILKIKLGSDVEHAIEVTQALCLSLPNAELLIDANQAWTLAESLEYLNAVERLKIELIEQPVIATDLEALKKITDATSIPILADEATFTLEDVKRVVESKSADMINIKLMKCGGVSKAIEILEYAREHNVKCMLGSMLEGPYSINAAIYLAFAYRDVIKYIDLDSPLLYKEASHELDFTFKGSSICFLAF